MYKYQILMLKFLLNVIVIEMFRAKLKNYMDKFFSWSEVGGPAINPTTLILIMYTVIITHVGICIPINVAILVVVVVIVVFLLNV